MMRNALQQYTQTIPQRQHYTEQQHLVLLRPAHHIHHHVPLHLEHHHPIIVENHVAGLLVRLLHQALLEGFLVFQGRVGVCAGVGGAGGEVRGRVRGGVVFCEEAGAVVGGEEEDRVDGEERHVGGHGCGLRSAESALGKER